MTATLATVATAKNDQAIATGKTTNVGERHLKMMRPIKVLHRHDGYISFSVRGEDVQWKQVISIRANALDEWFPQFTEQLLRDSQMSINGSYCTANRRTDLPYGRPLHRKDTLRYLCAAYVDLDYYDLGLKTYQVVGELARMRATGLIPQPSIEIDSGHGMWALWMLHDEADITLAHRGAFDDNPNDHLQLYVKINRELARRLAHLGSDSSPSASTHVRMHGSFRNDTERFVEWTAHGNAERPYSYTLKELAAVLGLELRERPKSEHLAIEASSRPKGSRSRAWKCSNQNRLTAVATIIDLRGGGFAEGWRNKGAFYYALSLKGNGETQEQALSAVLAMGKDCTPPLSAGECERAVREAYKGRKSVRLFYQTLADALDVDPGEAEIVSQKIAHHFPAASRHGEMVPLTHLSGEDTRDTRRSKRQAAIIELVDESRSNANGYVPSFREMAAKLRDRTGVDVSYITVRSDYAALEIASSWSHPPSPPVSGSFDFMPLECRNVTETLPGHQQRGAEPLGTRKVATGSSQNIATCDTEDGKEIANDFRNFPKLSGVSPEDYRSLTVETPHDEKQERSRAEKTREGQASTPIETPASTPKDVGLADLLGVVPTCSESCDLHAPLDMSDTCPFSGARSNRQVPEIDPTLILAGET